jgi:hypothetical protein
MPVSSSSLLTEVHGVETILPLHAAVRTQRELQANGLDAGLLTCQTCKKSQLLSWQPYQQHKTRSRCGL